MLAGLGLRPSESSTQIVEPEYLLRALLELNTAFGIVANLADDLRNLQRSEIDEVREPFGSRQVGSSTMPQKRNPWNCEHVKSLWKAFAPRVMTFFMDQVSEHQRDLTNSASARFVPEFIAGLTAAANRMLRVVAGLQVDRERMRTRLRESTSDLALAEAAYVLLAAAGDAGAHERVRRLTLACEQRGTSLLEAARADSAVWERLDRAVRRRCGTGAQEFFSEPSTTWEGRVRKRVTWRHATVKRCDDWQRNRSARLPEPEPAVDTILVLDFGGQTSQLIARRIRECGVFSRVLPGDVRLSEVERREEVLGIVLSGSPASVYDAAAPVPDPVLLRSGVPLLGICYGMQHLMQRAGGSVSHVHVREYGQARVDRVADSVLFGGIPASFRSWMSHGDAVERIAPGFRQIAVSQHGALAAVESLPEVSPAPVFGLQFHPRGDPHRVRPGVARQFRHGHLRRRAGRGIWNRSSAAPSPSCAVRWTPARWS